ncbi:hypothetical protein [Protaetiibacter mangrovi]|uniref:HEAT repeat domain-containing protein n=1 Tax=Protaetiibacter mangrovi TaxID=2970926 RepID=A0ABT1ZBA2_9MICO|nr:hypothetical protein [Protaetiibacter mangrovi]MCS0497976.1 hypothetical protein [Protaetiibacter mangrovi]TPX05224.1 hypothetical protein FJ656_07685 [Schumannella luteola]
MSCIRFNTPAQRAQLAALAPSMLTPEEAAAQHPAPPVTDSKIRRLRLLAADADPKIREAAASSYHVPTELYGVLAHDADEGVRACVARNTTTPCDVLRELADDASATVRGWVAVNYFVPADVMDRLADDEDPTVRGLVAWKSSLADDAQAESQAEAFAR